MQIRLIARVNRNRKAIIQSFASEMPEVIEKNDENSRVPISYKRIPKRLGNQFNSSVRGFMYAFIHCFLYTYEGISSIATISTSVLLSLEHDVCNYLTIGAATICKNPD